MPYIPSTSNLTSTFHAQRDSDVSMKDSHNIHNNHTLSDMSDWEITLIGKKNLIAVKKGRAFRDTLFGKVRHGIAIFLAKDNITTYQEHIVIKEYEKHLVEKKVTRHGERVSEDAMNELRIHSILSSFPTSSRHLLNLYAICNDAHTYYAILEYAAHGELFPLVQQSNFTRHVAREWFTQLVLGMNDMHKNRIYHRDLSLENLLLDERGQVKICDFGVAIQLPEGQTHVKDIGTRVGKLQFYMPPEVFQGLAYSPEKADIWTAGIILFVMLNGVHPFKHAIATDLRFQMVYEGRFEELLQKWKMPQMSVEACDLLRHMLCPPEQRWSVAQILNHPFITMPLEPAALSACQAFLMSLPTPPPLAITDSPALTFQNLPTKMTEQVKASIPPLNLAASSPVSVSPCPPSPTVLNAPHSRTHSNSSSSISSRTSSHSSNGLSHAQPQPKSMHTHTIHVSPKLSSVDGSNINMNVTGLQREMRPMMEVNTPLKMAGWKRWFVCA